MKKGCFYGDGFIACGDAPTDADLAEIAQFKRYLTGAMTMAEAREYVGMTVEEVARLARIPADRVTKIERGALTPTADEMAWFRKAYRVKAFKGAN